MERGGAGDGELPIQKCKTPMRQITPKMNAKKSWNIKDRNFFNLVLSIPQIFCFVDVSSSSSLGSAFECCCVCVSELATDFLSCVVEFGGCIAAARVLYGSSKFVEEG